MTGQAAVATDDRKRGQRLQDATGIAIGSLGIAAIPCEVSNLSMQGNLNHKAHTDQYTLAVHVRPH